MVFQKIKHTAYPPTNKPLMIWDGNCGFCAYWITKWQSTTKDKVNYSSYLEVAGQFPDIDLRHFKQASRLIEPSGAIFSGPRSAYRTFAYGSRWAFLDHWYENKRWFSSLSDNLYNWVTHNRGLLFTISKYCFGSNPNASKPFWLLYLILIGALLALFV